MSIKRLNKDEKATYLLGVAIRRYLRSMPKHDERTLREVEIVLQSDHHGLTDDEIRCIRVATGLSGPVPWFRTYYFDTRVR